MSVESSSLFFLIPMFSYFLFLQGIGTICNYFGYKLTLIIGIISISIGVLLLPPINFLPQSVIVVIIGLFILGIPGALINSPAICDMIIILKNKTSYDDAQVNDMASAIYNLGLNFGEAIGPTFGGYITENMNFATSAVYISLIALAYAVFFFLYNFNSIRTKIDCLKSIHDEKSEPLIYHNLNSDGGHDNMEGVIMFGSKN